MEIREKGAGPDRALPPLFVYGKWELGSSLRRRSELSDPLGQDASLVVDDLAGACHGASAAGQALVGENKGTVFRYLDSTGGAGLFAQATADAGNVAYMEATGILIGTEDNNGVGLYTEVDNTLGAGTVASTATDALALVNLGNTVGVDIDGTETAHIDTGAATGTAVLAQLGAFFVLLGAATAVTVDAGYLLGEFFLNDHGVTSFIGVRRACR